MVIPNDTGNDHDARSVRINRVLDPSWFKFTPLELSSKAGRNMLLGMYTKREIHKSRLTCMLCYLHYSCMCSNNRDRRRVKLFRHIVGLYNQQGGRCAITGQPLQRPSTESASDSRFFASIDRIDNRIGYEVGNVRLTIHWVNRALGKSIPSREMLEFGSLLFVGNKKEFVAKYIWNGGARPTCEPGLRARLLVNVVSRFLVLVEFIYNNSWFHLRQ